MDGEQLPTRIVPTRMVSHEFVMTGAEVADRNPISVADQVAWQLQMEDERLQRLLPDPPRGWYWQRDMQRVEMPGFIDEYRYRVVYRLKELQ